MYQNDLNFSRHFRTVHWGVEMILNFKMNAVLDEGTINNTFYHACITYIAISHIKIYRTYKNEWKEFSVYSD